MDSLSLYPFFKLDILNQRPLSEDRLFFLGACRRKNIKKMEMNRTGKNFYNVFKDVTLSPCDGDSTPKGGMVTDGSKGRWQLAFCQIDLE